MYLSCDNTDVNRRHYTNQSDHHTHSRLQPPPSSSSSSSSQLRGYKAVVLDALFVWTKDSMLWFCCLALDDHRPSSCFYRYYYVHLILSLILLFVVRQLHQRTQAPANRNARSKQWQPWLAACQRKRLRFLRFSFTQRTQRKRLRLNGNRALDKQQRSTCIKPDDWLKRSAQKWQHW